MSIKTFWTLLLKILGIYIVFQGLSVLPQFFITITATTFSRDVTETILVIGGLLIGPIVVLIFILWLFVYKTTWLINKLQLEDGFDEDRIELNIPKASILKIAIIIIGGLIFAESVPDLCRQIFMFVRVKQLFIENSNSNYIIFVFVKACVGYLLMTQSTSITQFILKQVNQQED